ncbi:hypothetical protein GCM10009802_15820 [Streptomyces synnematoformans]|uniref:Transposase n=1 Tax=Streptomyces synnematoformans TaxID=415721 RepID=A0ABN2XPE8_9ACTN
MPIPVARSAAKPQAEDLGLLRPEGCSLTGARQDSQQVLPYRSGAPVAVAVRCRGNRWVKALST